MNKPFFSVITTCLNRKEFIETAIHSVLAQNYDDFEHIIIDGGSTDGTLEVLNKFSHLHVISEPDNGVYDAFNKGVAKASGEVINFLNSDDRWGLGFLPEIKSKFKKTPSLEVIITGAGIYECDQERTWRLTKYLHALSDGERFFKDLSGRGPAINAWFIHRKLFHRIGRFNSVYKFSADLEFCIRAIIQNAAVGSLDIETYNYLAHMNSLTFHDDPEKRKTSILEDFQIIEKFLRDVDLRPYQKKYFKDWCRALSIREIKRGIRLVEPKIILTALKRYFNIVY